MLRNHLYYQFKPLFPQRLRMSVRRWFARRLRARAKDTWPILPGSERPPEGWTGWPDGKQFAFVLTHDVETKAGLDRVKPLAELEMQLGFRSSFNFVPEGEYAVPRELRAWLTARGFEVGVHDLSHDGKLFRSHAEFTRSAARINAYLKDWNAVGFRSAFMLRNLDWLHQIGLLYDSSTFDTDPFEPQPEGAGTIFPFVVGHPDAHGYVELPYTLPQDSTLFLLFRERSIALWQHKLEWLAHHGGMALADVHPDYLTFTASPSELLYPVSLYERFLRHVESSHRGQYWHVLPREAAEHVLISGARRRSSEHASITSGREVRSADHAAGTNP